MSLFDVKGWDVPSQTGIVGSASQSSKKRKRPANDASKVQSAQVNVEKLMRKVEKGVTGPRNDKRKKQRNGQRAEATRSTGTSDNDKKKSLGKETQVKAWAQKKNLNGEMKSTDKESSNTMNPSPSKRVKNNGSRIQSPSRLQHASDNTPSSDFKKQLYKSTQPSSGLTSLQASMKGSLDGARFRCSQSSRPFVF